MPPIKFSWKSYYRKVPAKTKSSKLKFNVQSFFPLPAKTGFGFKHAKMRIWIFIVINVCTEPNAMYISKWSDCSLKFKQSDRFLMTPCWESGEFVVHINSFVTLIANWPQRPTNTFFHIIMMNHLNWAFEILEHFRGFGIFHHTHDNWDQLKKLWRKAQNGHLFYNYH